jgi:hypothetical protein
MTGWQKSSVSGGGDCLELTQGASTLMLRESEDPALGRVARVSRHRGVLV